MVTVSKSNIKMKMKIIIAKTCFYSIFFPLPPFLRIISFRITVDASTIRTIIADGLQFYS